MFLKYKQSVKPQTTLIRKNKIEDIISREKKESHYCNFYRNYKDSAINISYKMLLVRIYKYVKNYYKLIKRKTNNPTFFKVKTLKGNSHKRIYKCKLTNKCISHQENAK